MPASYTLHPSHNLVHVRYVGTVTTDESAESFMSYIMSGQARPGHLIFIDFSECVELRMDFSDMVTLVAEKLGLLDPYEATMVTSIWAQDQAIYDMCMEYQRLTSGSEKQMVAVFHDRHKALSFLQISPEAMAEMGLESAQ
ncbi:MAG: hypothetical protein MK098_13960 [Marinovum sp.]|nr:hypothetical protein [Marinovum sp.]